jgi:hypothetical protein
MKLDIKWILIVGLSLILLWSFKTCEDKNKDIDKLELKNQVTDSMKNKLGQTVIIQEATITNNKQVLKHLTDSIFNLKKKQEKKIKDVIAYYSSITKIEIKDKLVPYKDTLGRKEWEDSVSIACTKVIEYYEANTITVPTPASDSTKNYKIDLTVTKAGVRIDSLFIPNKLDIRFVTIKGGLLKKDASGKRRLFTRKSIQVQVLNSNELLKTYDQKSILYKSPKKGRWLEKAALIGGGIFLGLQLNK